MKRYMSILTSAFGLLIGYTVQRKPVCNTISDWISSLRVLWAAHQGDWRKLTEPPFLACCNGGCQYWSLVQPLLSFISDGHKRVMHALTMYGFDQNGIDPHDNVPSRTLKYLLRTHLPQLQSRIQARVEQGLTEGLSDKLLIQGSVSLQ